MKKFKQFWKDLNAPPAYVPPLPMYGIGCYVLYGGFVYEVIDFNLSEDDGCWMYDIKRVDGTEEVANDILEPGITMKSQETYKAATKEEFMVKIDQYMSTLGINSKRKSVNIGDAGGVPNSLLARQDLETKTIKKSMDKSSTSIGVWYNDPSGKALCAYFPNQIDAEAFAESIKAVGMKDIKIVKGQVEQTGKELKEASKDAEDADTKTEVKSVVDNIKAVQIKRQGATILAREKTIEFKGKSFRNIWDKIK